MFDQILGHATTKRHLSTMVGNGRIGHSLLFSGPDGVGKALFATHLASHLVGGKGDHPDIHHYRPQGKTGMHAIDAMRRFAEEVYLDPYSAEKKVFVVHNVDRMLSYSANALLKTFEEPPPDTTLILLTSHPQRLLPTILSRCRHVRFAPLAKEHMRTLLLQEGDSTEEEIEAVLPFAGGSLAAARALLSQEGRVWRKALLELLAEGEIAPYRTFQQRLDALVAPFTEKREELTKALYQETVARYSDTPTAVQRDQIEKDVEGAAALALSKDIDLVFELIFCWYRDLSSLSEGTFTGELAFRSQEELLTKSAAQGRARPLALVEEACNRATLSLQRNTSFRAVIETLFTEIFPLYI